MMINQTSYLYKVQPVIIIPPLKDSKTKRQNEKKKKPAAALKKDFEAMLLFSDVYEKSADYSDDK